jgi:hypothetical protein
MPGGGDLTCIFLLRRIFRTRLEFFRGWVCRLANQAIGWGMGLEICGFYDNDQACTVNISPEIPRPIQFQDQLFISQYRRRVFTLSLYVHSNAFLYPQTRTHIFSNLPCPWAGLYHLPSHIKYRISPFPALTMPTHPFIRPWTIHTSISPPTAPRR